MKKFIILALAAVFLNGCVVYKHKRPSKVDANGELAFETTSIRAWFSDSAVAQLHSKVTTNDQGSYTREVGVDDMNILTDEDSLRVIEEISGSIARGIIGVNPVP